MITGSNAVVLLMMTVGIVGIVVPVLPGLLLVWAGALLYAYEMHDPAGWVVLAVATSLYAAGLVAQYVLPGRRLRAAGVGTPVIAVALAVGVIGFFVVPVIGAPIGFIGSIYLAERVTHRDHTSAWRATTQAVRAVALNIGIELGTALAILMTWVVAVLVRA